MKPVKEMILLFFKGMGMGGADVVPGVSGGTVAFITGIYEELLDSINSVDKTALQYLIKFDLERLWKHINGSFLLPLLLGVGVSIVTLAEIISGLLESHPIQVWSFFFGLIIISSITVAKEIRKWKTGIIISGIIGLIAAYGITAVSPAQTPTAGWFIFLSGALAICAMILPGISGSFILLILGKYTYIIGAIKNLDFVTIIIFGLGCITGLLSFSRLVSWCLKKYHDYAIAILAGFMLGSLNKIWPWKVATLFALDHHGEQIPVHEKNILPTEYLNITGNDPYIIQAIFFMTLGFMIIVILEIVARAISANQSNKG